MVFHAWADVHGNCLAKHTFSFLTGKRKSLNGSVNFSKGIVDGLARFQTHDFGKFLLPCGESIGDMVKSFCSLVCWQLS
jgi:hypothetical protein